jgi:ubiquinone/menaquinone biosynthesis C-methylase UbiE
MDPTRDTAYDAATSASFVEVDDKLGWTLGYPFALRALGAGGPDAPQTLLDYGCGPGKVAERVARLEFLADHSVDAAMSCFVFVVQPSREQLQAITAEMWRVLRPNGRFLILIPTTWEYSSPRSAQESQE